MYRLCVGLCLLLLAACAGQSPDTAANKQLLPSNNYRYVTPPADSLLVHRQTVYVPVYSDIYHNTGEQRFALTATLSVRNTSLRDSVYIHQIDYHGSEGELIREYLSRTVSVGPLESLEFVVENSEKRGGAGANFLLRWSATTDNTPLIQAVMIGTTSQQGISFVTEGIVIEED